VNCTSIDAGPSRSAVPQCTVQHRALHPHPLTDKPSAPHHRHEPHRKPAARLEGARRHRDLRHPRRLCAAAVPRDRALGAAAARHALARARRGLCGRCGGARPRRPGRGGRHLWRRRVQSGQRGGRRLCRACAAGGALGRAGRARGRQRLPAAPPGEDARFAVALVRGAHGGPRPARRRRARARADRPRAGRGADPIAPGVSRDPARHARPRLRRRAHHAALRARCRAPGRLRGRAAGPPGRRRAPGADGGRGGAPLRPRSARGRAGAAPGHPGGHQLHGPWPAGTRRPAPARPLHRPGGRPHGGCARRAIGWA